MSYRFPRCQIVPLPADQVSFQIDRQQRTRWHFGSGYPRPFFYPLAGPSGESLTRMGHPGAANHDHHRSVWFAHNQVLGIDFWSDRTGAHIRQKHWLGYRDGDEEAVMAALLGWYDGHDPRELLQQELVAAVRPTDREGETLLEVQSTFLPLSETLEFGQSNFGFFAVRVAKHISAHFGGGQLTSSEGKRGEPDVFGQPARWMDYSGPVPPAAGSTEPPFEGVTYFDHPQNPGYPNRWHVRADGWMGASICMTGPLQTRQDDPLRLRFLLHVHQGDVDARRAEQIGNQFAGRGDFQVERSEKKHQQYEVRRLEG